jgi:hypothetical protein
MFLLIGQINDALAADVRRALEEREVEVCAISDLFVETTNFSWCLTSTQTSSTLTLADETCLSGDDISGVFFRRSIDWKLRGVSSGDENYIQAEMQAAVLGWIWSLRCPVINRPPAWLWYCPKPPLQSWERLLRENGFKLPDLSGLDRGMGSGKGTIDQLSGDTSGSAVCNRGCVIGQVVVWNHLATENLVRFENALIKFAHDSGLCFVEIEVESGNDGVTVREIDAFPDLSSFCPANRATIAEHLARSLTDKSRSFQ